MCLLKGRHRVAPIAPRSDVPLVIESRLQPRLLLSWVASVGIRKPTRRDAVYGAHRTHDGISEVMPVGCARDRDHNQSRGARPRARSTDPCSPQSRVPATAAARPLIMGCRARAQNVLVRYPITTPSIPIRRVLYRRVDERHRQLGRCGCGVLSDQVDRRRRAARRRSR